MLFNRSFFEIKTSTCIDAKTHAYIINCQDIAINVMFWIKYSVIYS